MAKRVTKKAVNPNEMDGKEFFEAIHQIEQEKGIKPGYMMEKVTQALLAAYRRDHEDVGENLVIEADEANSRVRLFIKKEIVEEVDNPAMEISLEELGRLAGCSPYHFQRMFSYLAGVPLKEYIRRRRMTRAAADLRAGDKVLDVALRYGYDSPTAFNRAFQAVHGLAPSLAKQDGVKLKAFQVSASNLHSKETLKWNTRS